MLLSLAEKCCVSSDVHQTERNTHTLPLPNMVPPLLVPSILLNM